MMHAPTERLEEVVALLPGAERPTILPLAGDKQRAWRCTWSAAKPCSGETMEKLKALGASSILVLPIEKNDGVIGQPVTRTHGEYNHELQHNHHRLERLWRRPTSSNS
ncbi:hypothetical protein LNQ52_19890 [Klebsiella pneumoniae subsp. pneumoniae]|nr:hypothetical protein [Klebsiella pneumoniae subsp. pneumoniae]